MRKLIFPIIAIALMGIFSCAEGGDRNKESKEDEALVEEAALPQKQHEERAYYPIPSPEQMFGFINDNGVAYSADLINASSNAETYINPTEKALNFGVYTADLAYAAAYQDIESTIDLYKTVRRLGAELNIEEMMTEEMMQSVQANMEDPDSLAVIAGDSYYQAVEYLEQNGQEEELALMSLGGWIESLYITTSAISSFEENSPTADRIAAQKITFGNLYTYLKKNEEAAGVKEVLKDIQDIRSIFAGLKEERVAKTSSKEGGKLILGRGNKINISEQQFTQLKFVIGAYRSKITGATS